MDPEFDRKLREWERVQDARAEEADTREDQDPDDTRGSDPWEPPDWMLDPEPRD